MRKYLMALPVLLSALALGAAAPATAGAATARAVAVPAGVTTTSSGTATLARFGGFRARPSFGSRYRSPRYYRRAPGYRARPFHGLGGSILRALGIAYLVHALFGWGAGGGSPFGLLIVVALIAWLVTRTRRRRPYAY